MQMLGSWFMMQTLLWWLGNNSFHSFLLHQTQSWCWQQPLRWVFSILYFLFFNFLPFLVVCEVFWKRFELVSIVAFRVYPTCLKNVLETFLALCCFGAWHWWVETKQLKPTIELWFLSLGSVATNICFTCSLRYSTI